MISRVVAVSAVCITLVGCADADTTSTRSAERAASARSPAASESAANVVYVVCGKGAVTVENAVVRTHPDGVHFLIENPGGAWGVDLHHDSWANGTAENVQLKGEMTPDISAMGPGSVTVACLPTSHSSYTNPGLPTATLTIVDPDGLYVPWDLACGFGEQFRMTIAASPDEHPAMVFRRVPGVRPSDEFKKPNYPESPEYWPTVIVFRDGEEVARIGAPVIGSEWELLVNACPGSGIEKP